MATYDAMEEEMEDLRLTALALARAQTFQLGQAVSHEIMMERFGKWAGWFATMRMLPTIWKELSLPRPEGSAGS